MKWLKDDSFKNAVVLAPKMISGDKELAKKTEARVKELMKNLKGSK